MRLKWIVVTSITAFLFATGANAGSNVAKCIRHENAFPSPVSNATMFSTCEIKLLLAGQNLCAQAHKDCTNITEEDFTTLANINGMSPYQEIEAIGQAATREARGMCDLGRVPMAMYLYIYRRNNNTAGPMRWGTGFVCVPQNR